VLPSKGERERTFRLLEVARRVRNLDWSESWRRITSDKYWLQPIKKIPAQVQQSCAYTNTVPFHSIRQSRVTAPSKLLKCHGCHGDFHSVPNSFGSHMTNIEFFSSPAALNCPNFWACHGNSERLPKPKFRQVRHASRALPNWLKWYSNRSIEPVNYVHNNRFVWFLFLRFRSILFHVYYFYFTFICKSLGSQTV